MKKINVWENPTIQQVGNLDSRPIFSIKNKNVVDKSKSLNGVWNFKFFDCADGVNIEKEIASQSGWKKITVPGPIQTQGYDSLGDDNSHSALPLLFPKVDHKNPVGIYHKLIKCEELELENYDYILRFESIDSCMRLFVNKIEVGLTKGANYISEFDITEYLKSKENYIAVVVYKYSDSTYLDSKSEWWLTGIYRDVSLLVQPKKRVFDIGYTTVRLSDIIYDLNVSVNCTDDLPDAKISIFDANNKLINEKEIDLVKGSNSYTFMELSIKQWSAETPNLYSLRISYNEQSAEIKIGFRELLIREKTFIVNNKPIKFKGVNYNSFHPKNGRYQTEKDIREDMLLMKKFNINAIKTARYPQSEVFYALADELGFYVISEANVDTKEYSGAESHWLSNLPELAEAFKLRGVRMIKNFKHHPCIVVWSLGSNSGIGTNFKKMKEEMLKHDSTRPYLLESDENLIISDFSASKYPYLEKPNDFDRENVRLVNAPLTGKVGPNRIKAWQLKPHIMTEFGFAGGSGSGSLNEYFEYTYKNEIYNGGFVWQWHDQALEHKNWNLGPNYKNNFTTFNTLEKRGLSVCGLIFPNKKPKPMLYEYKQVIAPVVARIEEGNFVIENRYDFNTLENIKATFRVIDHNGDPLVISNLDLGRVEPRESVTLPIPPFTLDNERFYFINVKFELINDEFVLKSGHVVSENSFNITRDNSTIWKEKNSQVNLSLKESENQILVKSGPNVAIFSKDTGMLESLKKGSKGIIDEGPTLNMWRAYIDNDLSHTDWKSKYNFDKLTEVNTNFTWQTNEDESITILSETIAGTLNQPWHFRNKYTWTFHRSGELSFEFIGNFEGLSSFREETIEVSLVNRPIYVPRLGIKMKINKRFTTTKYFGLGPVESYVDSCTGKTYNLWESKINEMFTPYVRPQSNGNRHHTTWFELAQGKKEKVLFSCEKDTELFDFSISPFSEKAIDKANELIELKKEKSNYLYIDYDQQGLGNGIVGQEVLSKYWAKLEDFRINLKIKL